MKVLHLASQFLPWITGGTEVFCLRLCQQQQAIGVNTLVTFHSTGREPVGVHTYEGIPVQVLPSLPDARIRSALYQRTTQYPGSFQELLLDFRPDILHVHNFSVSQGLAHLRIAKQFGCKVVLTYHTPSVSCAQHGLLYRSRTVCDGTIDLQKCSECRLVGAGLHPFIATQVAKGSIPGLNPNSPHALTRLLTTRTMTTAYRNSWTEMVELVDALHVLAGWVEDIVKLNGVTAAKVHLIRTGGPTLFTAPTREPMQDGCLRIAFVGRSTWIKGMHVLVEAIQQLPPELPVRVTFFRNSTGWQEKAYGQRLQPQLEADDRFEVKYNLPNHQLLQTLTGFDVSVVPSLWLETGPLTVLEAFAAGLPVIGSRLGGIAELVQEGVNGLLFDPGNSQELANIIQQLVNNPAWLKDLRKNIQPSRTMADVATELVALYKTL